MNEWTAIDSDDTGHLFPVHYLIDRSKGVRLWNLIVCRGQFFISIKENSQIDRLIHGYLANVDHKYRRHLLAYFNGIFIWPIYSLPILLILNKIYTANIGFNLTRFNRMCLGH